MSHTPPAPPTPRRQPAYDAVYAVLHEWPALLDAPRENARVWRAVEAALDAMEPAPHLLPLLDLTADEVAALVHAAVLDSGTCPNPTLLAALDKLTTTDTTEESS